MQNFQSGVTRNRLYGKATLLFIFCMLQGPIPVAARSKAWVCGRSLAGIAGSIPAGDTDVCLL
jgi:hypothetical protein